MKYIGIILRIFPALAFIGVPVVWLLLGMNYVIAYAFALSLIGLAGVVVVALVRSKDE